MSSRSWRRRTARKCEGERFVPSCGARQRVGDRACLMAAAGHIRRVPARFQPGAGSRTDGIQIATSRKCRHRRVVAIVYGVTCHTLFTLAVGTMIAAMFYGMSRSLGRVAPPWSFLANAGLLMQFPLGHSLLLGGAGRRILGRLAPRQLGGRMSTTTYVIVASLQVFLLFAFWTPSGTIWWRAEGATLWILSCAYAAAWLLLLKAIWDAGLALQTGFLGWWAIFRDRAPVFPPMPTTGLFRFVRQPIYVAFALTLWTVPTWTPDQLAVAIVLTGYCLIGPLMKEARFRQRFGAAFVAYTRQVPYWLPRLRRRQPFATTCRSTGLPRTGGATRRAGCGRFAGWCPRVLRPSIRSSARGGTSACSTSAAAAASWRKPWRPAERRVTGIDPSAAAIEAARDHAGANALAIDYLVASGEALPFGAATFDIVVCVDVLEHIEAWDRVVSEVRRVLRPGDSSCSTPSTETRSRPSSRDDRRKVHRDCSRPERMTRRCSSAPASSKDRWSGTASSSGRFAGFGPTTPGPSAGTDLRAIADDGRPVSRPRSRRRRSVG